MIGNTLDKKSVFWIKKFKFFLWRAVSYSTFLLIPLYLPKKLHIGPWWSFALLFMYILFMMTQWFMLGKEIDHRFKIYFRVNSTVDRVAYRLYLGMFFFIFLFNLINLLSFSWSYVCYWIVWVLMGVYYSWPTRGKIIQESVTSHLGEFKFLDNFEKTVLLIIIAIFIFSFPELPPLVNPEMLKLYFDPLEKIAPPIWNFLAISFLPFSDHIELIRLAWSMFFYIVMMGLFLLLFYTFLRYSVSRRLSLLGVFALVSSWSFSKTLQNNVELATLTTFSLLWVWSTIWSYKSGTYRSGLFVGLVAYWGVLINSNFIWLMLLQIIFLIFYLLKDRGWWFRQQFLKYASLGITLTLWRVLNHYEWGELNSLLDQNFIKRLVGEVDKKAFFYLSFAGIGITVYSLYRMKENTEKWYKLETGILETFLFSIVLFILASYLGDQTLSSGFSLMWVLAFLSIIPLEFLFHRISKLRSDRNIIYVLYVLICLLDSHFEGRVKIFWKLFNN